MALTRFYGVPNEPGHFDDNLEGIRSITCDSDGRVYLTRQWVQHPVGHVQMIRINAAGTNHEVLFDEDDAAADSSFITTLYSHGGSVLYRVVRGREHDESLNESREYYRLISGTDKASNFGTDIVAGGYFTDRSVHFGQGSDAGLGHAVMNVVAVDDETIYLWVIENYDTPPNNHNQRKRLLRVDADGNVTDVAGLTPSTSGNVNNQFAAGADAAYTFGSNLEQTAGIINRYDYANPTPVLYATISRAGLGLGSTETPGVQHIMVGPDNKPYILVYVGVGGSRTSGLVARVNNNGTFTVIEKWNEGYSPELGPIIGYPREMAAQASTGSILLTVAATPDVYAGNPNYTQAWTIQKISDAFLPVVVPLSLSTLTDEFPTVSAAKWTKHQVVTASGGALVLGNTDGPGYVTTEKTYLFDRAEIEVKAPGHYGMHMLIESPIVDPNDLLMIEVDTSGATWKLKVAWNVGGEDGANERPFNVIAHRHLKIARDGQTVVFYASANGWDWSDLATVPVPYTELRAVKATLFGRATSIESFNILHYAPPVEPPGGWPPGGGPGGGGTPIGTTPPAGTLPNEIPETFEPGAEAPAKPGNTGGGAPGSGEPVEPTCQSLIELIREFSAQVKRPIRVVGPSTIEMVNINTPLPTGWELRDACDLFTTTEHELVAGEKTLSLDSNLLALSASGEMATNDIRLITSDWRLPHRLPLYGLGAGLVKRISYTFTPKEFRGSVEYHMRPVPLEATKR